jgi:hypothetical protein
MCLSCSKTGRFFTNKEVVIVKQASPIHKSRAWLWCLSLAGLLILLSACGDSNPPAKPAAWTNYQGQAFAMNYFSSWGVATKDLYLGANYPELEMLQGMAFTSPANGETTFVQVVYGDNTSGKASVSDLLSKYILGTPQQPVAASSLTITTLAGETWSQGVVQKPASGSGAQLTETALGVSHVVNGKTEIYLIIYQGDASDKTNQPYFTRMINSFKFAS